MRSIGTLSVSATLDARNLRNVGCGGLNKLLRQRRFKCEDFADRILFNKLAITDNGNAVADTFYDIHFMVISRIVSPRRRLISFSNSESNGSSRDQTRAGGFIAQQHFWITLANARAIATRAVSDRRKDLPDSCRACHQTDAKSSNSVTRRLISSLVALSSSSGNATFINTVQEESRLKCWKIVIPVTASFGQLRL